MKQIYLYIFKLVQIMSKFYGTIIFWLYCLAPWYSSASTAGFLWSNWYGGFGLISLYEGAKTSEAKLTFGLKSRSIKLLSLCLNWSGRVLKKWIEYQKTNKIFGMRSIYYRITKTLLAKSSRSSIVLRGELLSIKCKKLIFTNFKPFEFVTVKRV